MSDRGTDPPDGCTEDGFLGGRLRLRQPAAGYRAAIDPVFLAAAVDARSGEHVLDVGAGHGTAALCLARRVAGCRVWGLEAQQALAEMANDNARLNGVSDRVDVRCADLAHASPAGFSNGFDHVMANPPFLDPSRDDLPKHEAGRLSRAEGAASLETWLAFMLRMARPGAYITLVHRADRLDRILSAIQDRAGGVVVFPLWPRRGLPAKRVILRARKGSRTPLRLAAGMCLHLRDGAFSPEARTILEGAGLDITGPRCDITRQT